MAAPTTVLTVIKKFTYRGNATEEYSNTYALTGATPADNAAWRTLFDALVTQEKTIYKADISVVGGYGYNKIPVKGDHAVWSVDLTVSPNTVVVGTGVSAGISMPGDTALWIRWGLDRYNTKGKRVYLRKYFHPAYVSSSLTNQDVPVPAWTTAANAFGQKMRDGTFAEGRTITDRLGTAVIGHATSPYTTVRTLKRRGKRPPTSAAA